MLASRVRASAHPTKKLMALAASLGLGLMLLAVTRSLVCSQAGAERTFDLMRGPYLQSVTTNSVIVVWDTDQATTSRVDYGPTTAYGLVVSDVTSVTHHALTLTLTVPGPYSVYHYQASSNGQLLGGDNSFRTAAAPTQTTFSFVAFGDTRTNATAHQSVVNRIVTLSPDFVLHTGDFVADGRITAQWATFFAIEQDLLRQSPLFGALGNHEENSANYFDAFHLPGNERWYSFDYGNAHFIALQIDNLTDYASGDAQYTWLENDLSNTDKLWKFVFFHIPPHSSGYHGGNSTVRDTLGPLFVQYDVDLVFNGHDHGYERSVVGDVVYIVTGGGGAPPRGQENLNPYSAYYTSTHHCVSVTIDGPRLSSVGVRPDGTEFDLFTISKKYHNTYLPLILRDHYTGKGLLLLPHPTNPSSR